MSHDKSAAVEGIEQQEAREKRLASEQGEEAHADGEKGKPTARDATGQKMDGYAHHADEEEDEEAERRARLRREADSSLP